MSTITSTTVQRIQALAEELFNIGNTTLEKVTEAGRLLTECKKGLPHGKWIPWLEENFTFTDRTARRWMKLHEDSIAGRIKTDTVSGLAEAYKLTTEPRRGLTGQTSTPPRQTPPTVTIEAEIVEPQTPAQETAPEKIPKWIPDDAERLWTLAKINLDKIIPSDKSREKVLNQVIAYCHGRLDQKRDALAAIVATVPRLTKDEVKSLIEILTTRWT